MSRSQTCSRSTTRRVDSRPLASRSRPSSRASTRPTWWCLDGAPDRRRPSSPACAGTHGFSVGVYLWLSETKECAVYTTAATAQTPEEYRALQTEALGFVESMGFMMDNLNFRSLSPEHQAELLQSVPVWRGGRAATGGTPAVAPAGPAGAPAAGPARPWRGCSRPSRSLAAPMLRPPSAVLALAAAGVLGSAASTSPPRRSARAPRPTTTSGINAQSHGRRPRARCKEFEESLKLDPDFADAHNAIAVLLHLVLRPEGRGGEALQAGASRFAPAFSEAKVNLGNLYLDQGRLDEAIALYEQALNDMLYATPYIAEANLGWAYFKKGNSTQAIEHLRAAVTPTLSSASATRTSGWSRTRGATSPRRAPSSAGSSRPAPRCPRRTSSAAAASSARGARPRPGRASTPASQAPAGRPSSGCGSSASGSATGWEGRAPGRSRKARVDRWEDEALVLGTLDYGEADRLVTLLTRRRGKLTAFAAGARKSRRRFAGALEPGTLLRARLVERHGSTFRLDAVEVVHGLPPHPRRAAPHRPCALRAGAVPRAAPRATSPRPSSSRWPWSGSDGWTRARPGPPRCSPSSSRRSPWPASCRASTPARSAAGPRARRPGSTWTTGARCAPGVRARATGPRIDPALLAGLAAIQAGARQPLPPALRAEARGLLARFIEAQLGRRLKSVDFLRSVGVD